MIQLLVLLVLGAPAHDEASSCAYDRALFLRLDERSFDQDVNQGWRSLEAKGCYETAADSIADYRRARGAGPGLTSLYFHEAQMRAYAGDYATALDLLPLAKHQLDYFGWNDYVDATAAFLRRDLDALAAAREELIRTPTPDSHRWFDEAGKEIPPPPWSRGDPWPHNLAVVDGLIRCFDRTYREAYGSAACATAR